MRIRPVIWFFFAWIMLVVLPYAGCVAGDRLFVSLDAVDAPEDELQEDWELLPEPPEEVAELIDATRPETAWIRGISGQIYRCTWITRFDNQCWIEEEAVFDDVPYQWDDEPYEGPSFPYPERVKQTIAKHYESRYPAAVKLVLLEDGTIQRWNYGGFLVFGAHRSLALFCTSIGGMTTMGLFLGIVLAYKIVTKKVLGRN